METTAQPIRGKKAREDREYDRTSLREAGYGERVHRDYAAHYFRWGFARRFLKRGMAVLDAGCGVDGALVKVLAASLSWLPSKYVGVDYNKLTRVPKTKWATYHERFDLTDSKAVKALGTFDMICSFEVIEHMPVAKGKAMLQNLRQCLKPGAQLLLSTPVFNGKAARNHIHEYTIPELQDLLVKTGWTIKERFGTFASQRDLKPVLTKAQAEVLAGLKRYYDDDVIACFLAPLHPDQSRNNVWVCS